METTFAANLPPIFEEHNSKQGQLALFDLTQHSAAMLCDLQCRSQSNSSRNNSWWAAFFLHLMTLNLQTTSQTLILAFWTHFPSQTARLISRSMRRLTSRTVMTSLSVSSSTTTPLQSRSTRAQAQLNAATAGVSSRQQRATCVRAYLKARAQAVAARHRHQNGSVCDTLAFEETGKEPDIALDEGNGGVGR